MGEVFVLDVKKIEQDIVVELVDHVLDVIVVLDD